MLTTLLIAVMTIALFLTPLGVPGLWIMVGVLALGTWLGHVSVFVLVVCSLLALTAEIVEFFIVQKLNVRYGGSRRAFWGAMIGGVVGVLLGMPVPVIGSVIAGFVGSFAGAAIATFYETKEMGAAGRVGWGVMLGKMWAAAVKMSLGFIILVLGAASLLG